MIVLDASAMVEALIGREASNELLDALTDGISAPHLLDVEVLSVLRGLLLGGKLDSSVAEEARRDHFAFAINRYDVAPLADRMWRLRHHYTSYDAAYLALAEALEAPLYTYSTERTDLPRSALLPMSEGPSGSTHERTSGIADERALLKR